MSLKAMVDISITRSKEVVYITEKGTNPDNEMTNKCCAEVRGAKLQGDRYDEVDVYLTYCDTLGDRDYHEQFINCCWKNSQGWWDHPAGRV
jgi:hypothetical protein